MSPPRIVTVWYPDWPVVAAGLDPDVPAAVMQDQRVVARTAAAVREGVLVGQRRREAQRRCPAIVLVERDGDREAREFEPIVGSVAALAARIDVVEPGWISLAARGPSRYFGGDHALADRLRTIGAAGPSSGPGPGIGVADGRFASSVAARLAARRGSPIVVAPGGSPAFCHGLPIGWLHTLGEADPGFVELLGRLGVRRLGDLAALPAADVLGRFGPPGVHAHRLAAGADIRPANSIEPSLERRVDHVLDDPAAHAGSVVFIAKQLADELATSLTAQGRVCTRLVVLLESEHGERSERSWYRADGLNAPAIVERVRWQLDAWINLPRGSDQELTGGITLIRLNPDEVRADNGRQLGLWGGQTEHDRRATRAIARLTTLTSESAVIVPVWRGGRSPNDRYRWVPATLVDLERRALALADAATGTARQPGDDAPWPGVLPSPSPATVYEDPRPAAVFDERGEIVNVSGRGMLSARPATLQLLSDSPGGSLQRRIAAWAGPWPVEERWWAPHGAKRIARFQVVTEDGDGYLVVVERGRWWISARYD